jgi:hypothetical protein
MRVVGVVMADVLEPPHLAKLERFDSLDVVYIIGSTPFFFCYCLIASLP